MRRVGYLALVVLSLGVAGYAIAVYGFLPLGVVVHPDMRTTFEAHRAGILLHVFAAMFGLLLGPFQFWARLRSERPRVHRAMGRLYLGVGVLTGGLAGLYMAFHAFGGPVARSGFVGLAILWLYTGLRAYLAIRAGDVTTHRRWMVRNFSLTFTAVMLRLWLPLSQVAGVPFERAYPVVAWLSWVPNLVVAELLFNRRRGASIDRTTSSESRGAV
jgi:uncharacterized membrane protein